MTKKMLMDASHPEETRVVIVDGNRVEELDFESRNKRQLRGNVYLARVTRVEPSLQAAFVEFGGNRHGFLAFSEIHPDYYQIPFEDRMALIEAEEAENRAEEEDADNAAEASDNDESDDNDDDTAESQDEDDSNDDESSDDDSDTDEDGDDDESDEDDDEAVGEDVDVVQEQAQTASNRRKRISRRRYKIQEVVKRGQILLIQAVKEERGNKGAAMTTYLSLAGRYCVLMPNTPRGGGISRKIANGSDRKRLKSIMSDLPVPQGMGVIVRTAGAKRTKPEINRDYDYLSRLWETIRDNTLKSIAPALIHEEGNLIKRSIRDLYNKDIEEVLVEGEEAYKTAKDFIKMLMPSHAKNVKQYKDDIPLFLRYNVERQIEDSLKSVVQLKSGGYLVIHPTEALVSVDVNSGRSTKERNVERTALKTNLEAAEEVARQMRLRDLAGLVVIDFIDMDEFKNNRAVEKRMKDSLTRDRARVQTSRISQFGLMEISRQRRRRSLLEGSTVHCEHCEGVGRKRTIESSALAAIRAVEEIGVRGKAKRVRLRVSSDVALYLFNEKRDLLQQVDDSTGMFTEVVGDATLLRPTYEIDVIEKSEKSGPDPLEEIEREFKKQRQEDNKSKNNRRRSEKDDDETEDSDEQSPRDRNKQDDDESGGRKKRKRRGRRGNRGRKREDGQDSETESNDAETGDTSATESETGSENADEAKPKKRSTRRRAPSRSKRDAEETPANDSVTAADDTVDAEDSKPKRKRTTRKAPARKPVTDEKPAEDTQEDDKPAPKRRRKAPAKTVKAAEDTVVEKPEADVASEKPAARSTARRKAPSRKTEEPAKKPARKSSKSKAVEPVSEEAVEPKKTKSPATRRKAPARKPAEEPVAETKKPAARKKAAKAKPAAEEPKKTDEVETKDEKKSRSTARRKAPSRASSADSVSVEKTVTEDNVEEKPKKRSTTRRKAPTR